jgi:hypothetical protein
MKQIEFRNTHAPFYAFTPLSRYQDIPYIAPSHISPTQGSGQANHPNEIKAPSVALVVVSIIGLTLGILGLIGDVFLLIMQGDHSLQIIVRSDTGNQFDLHFDWFHQNEEHDKLWPLKSCSNRSHNPICRSLLPTRHPVWHLGGSSA